MDSKAFESISHCADTRLHVTSQDDGGSNSQYPFPPNRMDWESQSVYLWCLSQFVCPVMYRHHYPNFQPYFNDINTLKMELKLKLSYFLTLSVSITIDFWRINHHYMTDNVPKVKKINLIKTHLTIAILKKMWLKILTGLNTLSSPSAEIYLETWVILVTLTVTIQWNTYYLESLIEMVRQLQITSFYKTREDNHQSLRDRNRIVIGIYSEEVREELLNVEGDLDLTKCISISHRAEATKSYRHQMAEPDSGTLLVPL